MDKIYSLGLPRLEQTDIILRSTARGEVLGPAFSFYHKQKNNDCDGG